MSRPPHRLITCRCGTKAEWIAPRLYRCRHKDCDLVVEIVYPYPATSSFCYRRYHSAEKFHEFVSTSSALKISAPCTAQRASDALHEGT